MIRRAIPPKFGVEQDDLFTTTATTPLDFLHAITCAVCRQQVRIFVGLPGDLCELCRADLAASKRHVEEALELAWGRLQALIEQWEQALSRASAEDQARWAGVVEARVKVHKGKLEAAIFQARWAKTLALGDGLSALLRTHEDYEAGCGEVERVEVWAVRAMEELRIAEGAE